MIDPKHCDIGTVTTPECLYLRPPSSAAVLLLYQFRHVQLLWIQIDGSKAFKRNPYTRISVAENNILYIHHTSV
jgi:hypothetical protein